MGGLIESKIVLRLSCIRGCAPFVDWCWSYRIMLSKAATLVAATLVEMK